MLARLRRGKETPWDIRFYHHEKAEADRCRPYLDSKPDIYLQKQRGVPPANLHELTMRSEYLLLPLQPWMESGDEGDGQGGAGAGEKTKGPQNKGKTKGPGSN